MTDTEATDVARTLLEGAPGMEFRLRRVQSDGSVKEIPIWVQLLRVAHHHAAMIAAQKYAKEKGEVSKEYGDVYREAQAVELLLRALHKPEEITRSDGTKGRLPLFISRDLLLNSFTEPEMAQCLNMYELVRARFGGLEGYSDEEFSTWVERLSHPMQGPFFLTLLDSSHLPELILRMASEIRTLSDQLGLPLSTSPDSSASDQANSTERTGSSSQLPSAQSVDGIPLPENKLWTKDEAKEKLKKFKK